MALPYKKILLPLDGSGFSTEALPHAEEIARSSGAQLVLFQVIPDTHEVLSSAESLGAFFTLPHDPRRDQALDTAQRYLDDLATSLRHRQIDARSDIGSGDPATAIIDHARHEGIDLIVMSTHGRTGLARWAYGSVAHKVLQATPCAVLVVRPVGF